MFLTAAVWIIGIVSVSFSLWLSIYFFRSGWPIGTALALEKMIDCIDSTATLAFTTNAMFTGNNEINMHIASLLRLLILVPPIFVGWHLFRKTHAFYSIKRQSTVGRAVENAAETQRVDVADLLGRIGVELDSLAEKANCFGPLDTFDGSTGTRQGASGTRPPDHQL